MIHDRFNRIVSALGLMLLALTSLLASSQRSAYAEEVPEFSHSLHVSNEEIGCTDCHDPTPKSGLPTLKPEACLDCHDEQPVVTIAAPSRRLHEIRFPHALHVKTLKCQTCHTAIIEETQQAGHPLVSEPQCVSCHAKTIPHPQNKGCVTCHGQDQRMIPPADHKRRGWLSTHGREAELREFDPVHGLVCSTCHRKSDCRACHTTQRPRSHTALWRLRGHGVAARWDRGTCKTCHETGSCAGCHARTEPMNHRGAWRSTHGLVAQTRDQGRCLTCHERSTCNACHQGATR